MAWSITQPSARLTLSPSATSSTISSSLPMRLKVCFLPMGRPGCAMAALVGSGATTRLMLASAASGHGATAARYAAVSGGDGALYGCNVDIH
eukprot:1536770-Rhodomonas_salina.1